MWLVEGGNPRVDACLEKGLEEYCPAVYAEIDGDVSQLDDSEAYQAAMKNCENISGFMVFMPNCIMPASVGQ